MMSATVCREINHKIIPVYYTLVSKKQTFHFGFGRILPSEQTFLKLFQHLAVRSNKLLSSVETRLSLLYTV